MADGSTIGTYLDAQRGAFEDTLATLLRLDSQVIDYGASGREGPAQQVVAERLRVLGLVVDVFEPDNARLAPYYDHVAGHDYTDRPNVVATWPGTGGGRSLILNGHVDTVPPGDASLWRHGPFSGDIEQGHIYGRGAADMKGGLAALLCAVEALVRCGVRLRGDLIVQSVVDEEGDGNGTLACCDRGYRADGAVVAEPTDFDVVPAFPGVGVLELIVRGKAGHYATKYTPKAGVNAIHKMRRLMDAMDELERERIALRDETDDFTKLPLISISRLWGGESIATLAGECRAQYVIEYFEDELSPDGTDRDFRQAVESHLRRAEAGDAWLVEHPSELKWLAAILPCRTRRDHPLAATALEVARRHAPDARVSMACSTSDARHLFHRAHTPVIHLGPGKEEHFHAVDERLCLDDYHRAIRVYVDLIQEWCGVAD